MYEFVVLSLLIDGPMHGYKIRTVMNYIVGPFRTIAWGPLYGTLRKLQAAGMIAPLESPSGSRDIAAAGPPSKQYRITEAGRLRFQELMRVPEHREPDYQFQFGLRLCRLGLVDPAQRLALLRDYLGYCDEQLDFLTRSARDREQSTTIPANLKPWILLTLDRRRAIWEADRAWIQTHIHEMEATAQYRIPVNVAQ
ncbi:MAG: PadR family transcriptional regulator [Chloroflexota bacterium]